MKKLILLGLLVLCSLAARSQEHLYFGDRVRNYYYGDFWIDQYTYGEGGDIRGITDEYGYQMPPYASRNHNHTVLKKVFTSDYLRVVGIAVVYYIMATDTSCLKWEPEQLLLYKHRDSSMTLLAQAEWSYFQDIDYYYHMAWTTGAGTLSEYSWVNPVYECYFENPVIVTDSFYVGSTKHNEQQNYTGGYYIEECQRRLTMNDRRTHLAVQVAHGDNSMPGIDTFTYNPHPEYMWYHEYSDDTTWHLEKDPRSFLCIFPIIDTNYKHSSNIDPAELEKKVDLSPNPTTGKTLLSSDVMIRDVEVFAADGRRVEHKTVNGNSMPFHSDRWPKGLYLFHVHTTSGTVVRKLMVQ